MAENSFWGNLFNTTRNSARDAYFNGLNAMQGHVQAPPQPMQQQQQMPNFGDGVAAQQAKNQGLIGGLRQIALNGLGRDIEGWPIAAGPNPNPWAAINRFAGAHARARAAEAAGPFRDAAAKEAHDRATGQQVWGRDQAWIGNPRTMQQIDENVARISRQDQERNGWVFPNPNGAEQYGRQLKYGSTGMLPMDYRGPGAYYAGAGPDAPYEKWQPDNSFWGNMSRPRASGPYNPWNTPYNQDTLPAHLQLAGAGAAGNPWAGVIAGMQGMFNPRMALPRAEYELARMEKDLRREYINDEI
jgi:hypothetical protein